MFGGLINWERFHFDVCFVWLTIQVILWFMPGQQVISAVKLLMMQHVSWATCHQRLGKKSKVESDYKNHAYCFKVKPWEWKNNNYTISAPSPLPLPPLSPSLSLSPSPSLSPLSHRGLEPASVLSLSFSVGRCANWAIPAYGLCTPVMCGIVQGTSPPRYILAWNEVFSQSSGAVWKSRWTSWAPRP